MAEDKKTSQLEDGGTVLNTDSIPVVREGITMRAVLEGYVAALLGAAEELTTVLATDMAFIMRDGVIYRATTANLLAASAPPAGAGQLDFSNAGNSGLAAGAM